MLDKIKRILSFIFPMSASRLDERLLALEKNLTDTITEQNEMLTRLETRMSQTVACQAKLITDALEQLESRLSESIGCQEEMADRSLGQLDTKLTQLEERHSETAANVIEILRTSAVLEGLSERVSNEQYPMLKTCIDNVFSQQAALAAALDEILHGDVFHRIEFSQGKLVRLESILQKNMLALESQRGSQEYAFIMRMRSLFPLVEVEHEKEFIRIGRENDGGYVMLDDFEGKKIAYSFGIADDVSWDMDMAKRGLDVYMYDHTIEGIPEQNERFHYHHIGIGASGESTNPQLKSLADLMESNGHRDEYGMILKLDVEGAEWDVLCDIDLDILKHFSQIVIEFHGLTNPENEGKIKMAMDKLNTTHQLVHIHANNYGSYMLLGGAILPELIEATYLLKGEYTAVGKSRNIYCKADSINCMYLPDISLDGWN